jgi:cytochrome c2
MRIAVLVLCLALGACSRENPEAERGRLLLRQFGCGACHEIPGVAAADGKVGPPLAGIARRVYLAGVLPNTPQNMIAFIRAPEKADPRTTMPNLGVTDAHARDMTAYLSTLK